MAWFTRFTRFGDVHLVYSQEAENSCGIACVMMTVFKISKLSPGVRSLYKEKQITEETALGEADNAGDLKMKIKQEQIAGGQAGGLKSLDTSKLSLG